MRFSSKNLNLRVVLRPGVPGNVFAGKYPEPGVYVKFVNGIAEVRDEDKIKAMLKHDGFNSDFVSCEELEVDPFKGNRKDSEPVHVITNMQFGQAVGTVKTPTKPNISPELESYIKSVTMSMATEMAKTIAEDTIKDALRSGALVLGEPKNSSTTSVSEVISEPQSASEAPAKRRGRPPRQVDSKA